MTPHRPGDVFPDAGCHAWVLAIGAVTVLGLIGLAVVRAAIGGG